MRLAWHIAKKDIRRLALPVGAWIAFIVLPTIALAFYSPSVEGHASSSIDETATLISIWTWLLQAIQVVIGYVLVAALVLEDPVQRTNAFWMTRPIARAQLLGAKVIAASVLFLIAPGLALAPVWLANGFSVGEALVTWGTLMKWQGVATLLALTLASLSRNLAQVLLYSFGLPAALFAIMSVTAPFFSGVSVPVRQARDFLSTAGMLPFFAFVLARQFVTRGSRGGWATLGLAFIACIAIRAAWPWELGIAVSSRASAPPHRETPADRAAEIIPAPTWTKFDSNPRALPTLFVSAPWGSGGHYVPVALRFADGRVARPATGPGVMESGLRVLGFDQENTPLRWQIHLPPRVEPDRASMIEVWSVRPRVLGEMPLRVGAELVAGAHRVQIADLARTQGRLDAIFLEVRDSHAELAGSWYPDSADHIDQYFLVNRRSGKAWRASATDFSRPIVMNGLARRFSRLHVSGNEDGQDLVLVKLRYEGERRFERPLEPRGVTVDPRGKGRR